MKCILASSDGHVVSAGPWFGNLLILYHSELIFSNSLSSSSDYDHRHPEIDCIHLPIKNEKTSLSVFALLRRWQRGCVVIIERKEETVR